MQLLACNIPQSLASMSQLNVAAPSCSSDVNLRVREHNWLALAAWSYVAIVLGLAVGDAWSAPFSSDEGMYYLPAIEKYAEQLPRHALNPPFPGPPTGLLLQALVYRLFHCSWFALRVMSTAAILALAGVTYRYLRQYGRSFREATLLLMLCGHPFVIYHAFVFKQHSFMLLFLAIGLFLWELAKPEGSHTLLAFASSFLALAVTTNQLTCGVCAALACEAWLTRHRNENWRARILAAGAPVAILCLFFLLWGGTIPPAYRSQPIVANVRFDTLHFAQLLACFLTLGVWLAPSVGIGKSTLLRSVGLAVPFAIGFYYWNGYDPGTSFYDTIVGPISSFLRLIYAKSRVVACIAGGLICGLGADLVWRERVFGRGIATLSVLVVCYATMMLVVPYLFECYYVVLYVAAWILLRRKMMDAWPSPWVVGHGLFVALLGVAYSIYKVSGILTS